MHRKVCACGRVYRWGSLHVRESLCMQAYVHRTACVRDSSYSTLASIKELSGDGKPRADDKVGVEVVMKKNGICWPMPWHGYLGQALQTSNVWSSTKMLNHVTWGGLKLCLPCTQDDVICCLFPQPRLGILCWYSHISEFWPWGTA